VHHDFSLLDIIRAADAFRNVTVAVRVSCESEQSLLDTAMILMGPGSHKKGRHPWK